MNNLLHAVTDLAKQAGTQVLAIYQNPIAVTRKQDQSPLTQADLISDQIIREGLQHLTPDLPLLSEEYIHYPFDERQRWQRYWLLDPLDGTCEFISKSNEFTVNIALIEQHQPILGIIYAPALQLCYFASRGQGAFKQIANNERQSIHTRAWQADTPLRVLVSRQQQAGHYGQFLSHLGPVTIIPCGSALKFALVAEAMADIYPRLMPTLEWDTAAGQCILEEAGGQVIDSNGQVLHYNRKLSLENGHFLAVGDKYHDWGIMATSLCT